MDEVRSTLYSQQLRFDAPLDADEIPEFHAARLLILLHVYKEANTSPLRGRTKLAKLDFFVRYPMFLEVALERLRSEGRQVAEFRAGSEGVEASMVRYRFGPWDHRYYNLLALLDGRALLRIGGGNVETYSLTNTGHDVAEQLVNEQAFSPLVERCRVVVSAFSRWSGTDLKSFVYDTFVDEIAAMPQGVIIRPSDQGQRRR